MLSVQCYILISLDTLLSFFPSNSPSIENIESEGDLYHHILDKLTNHPRYPSKVYTVFDLMALIVLMSSSIMLETSHASNKSTKNLDVFYMYEKLITKRVRANSFRAVTVSMLTP